jgi:glutamate synthase (ferredoxin)
MEGKPFSRSDFEYIVRSGKYQKTLISFGSKRDFDRPGWYLRNALFPKLAGELAVVREPRIDTWSYDIASEGLFRRQEHLVRDPISPWTLPESHAPVLGGARPDRDGRHVVRRAR